MSDSGGGVVPAEMPDFFVRMFRGNVGLALTFWVFGLVIPALLAIVSIVILGVVVGYSVAANSGTVGGSAKLIFYSYMYVYTAAFTAYDIFIYIAIWRSARKYTGLKLWKVLAQVCVVGSWLFLPFTLYNFPAEAEEIYDEMVTEAGARLSDLP